MKTLFDVSLLDEAQLVKSLFILRIKRNSKYSVLCKKERNVSMRYVRSLFIDKIV
jgi:hypothetical protein